MTELTQFLNSIRNQVCRSVTRGRGCDGLAGSSNADHALSDQAMLVLTMYAQLLTRLSTGAFNARTPLARGAMRFSWSQRSLQPNTISSQERSRSLVIENR